jgi:hypothetical protein
MFHMDEVRCYARPQFRVHIYVLLVRSVLCKIIGFLGDVFVIFRCGVNHPRILNYQSYMTIFYFLYALSSSITIILF